MESKNLGEILKKWSGINLKEDTILIFGKDNVKFDSLEDAVKAGEFQPTLKRASDLVIEDLNGLKLEVTKKDDLKDLYNFLKSWFGDSAKSSKKNESSYLGKNLEELKSEIKALNKDNIKRTTLTLDLKKNIFHYYKNNSISKKELAGHLGIAEVTLNNLIRDNEKS